MKYLLKSKIKFSGIVLLIILIHSCKKDDSSGIRDGDGNGYSSVTIGEYVWLVENLKTTRYNDGTKIPLVPDPSEWSSLTTDGYCWFNNDASKNKAVYGALYNWYAVNTGNLCPVGWHVPSYSEWNELVYELGGKYFAGPGLKETGTAHWDENNTSSTNESGFTALPGGYRDKDGLFLTYGNYSWFGAKWWSATEDKLTAGSIGLGGYSPYVDIRFDLKSEGYSIRCMQDYPPPIITMTDAATKMTETSTTLNGTVNANNEIAKVSFEYGASTSYGQIINAAPNEVVGNTYTTVTANLSNLTPNTLYHFRLKSSSSGKNYYGSDMQFYTSSGGIAFNTILSYGSVADIEGNRYKTILIGTHLWMAENLKTGTYNDLTPIPLVTNETEWSLLTTPGSCWYNNDSSSYNTVYGKLYNWYTVNTGKLCPKGWRVPSSSDWSTLATDLGGYAIAGSKLKESGSLHWSYQVVPNTNTGATNESGFTALPGGYRIFNGKFSAMGGYGFWWSSTEYNGGPSCNYRGLFYMSTDFGNGYDKKINGYSVRCIMD
jgi:uncharacterized protein (TIGR02145 family)